MILKLYQIDAFASRPFTGNPAAVVPLDAWLPDATLQAIGEENNLAETAYFVNTGSALQIRWFTPLAEVKLCGHATLASAFVLFNFLDWPGDSVVFQSASGPLSVSRNGAQLTLDFPSQAPESLPAPQELVTGLGSMPRQCLANEDYVAVFESEQELASLRPDFYALAQLDRRGVIVTAPGDTVDFVARFFAPKLGVPEDPVTGSAYTHLTPYWAVRLNKAVLKARQISRRGGEIGCELHGDRVHISGHAVSYLEGTIDIGD